ATVRVPDVIGMTFVDARAEVRGRGLDWQLVFGGLGNDETVWGTLPSAGTVLKTVDRGQILVIGSAPRATVPDVLGVPCDTAAAAIIDAGLYPRYRTGARTGTVIQVGDRGDLHWNDMVDVTCSG